MMLQMVLDTLHGRSTKRRRTDEVHASSMPGHGAEDDLAGAVSRVSDVCPTPSVQYSSKRNEGYRVVDVAAHPSGPGFPSFDGLAAVIPCTPSQDGADSAGPTGHIEAPLDDVRGANQGRADTVELIPAAASRGFDPGQQFDQYHTLVGTRYPLRGLFMKVEEDPSGASGPQCAATNRTDDSAQFWPPCPGSSIPTSLGLGTSREDCTPSYHNPTPGYPPSIFSHVPVGPATVSPANADQRVQEAACRTPGGLMGPLLAPEERTPPAVCDEVELGPQGPHSGVLLPNCSVRVKVEAEGHGPTPQDRKGCRTWGPSRSGPLTGAGPVGTSPGSDMALASSPASPVVKWEEPRAPGPLQGLEGPSPPRGQPTPSTCPPELATPPQGSARPAARGSVTSHMLIAPPFRSEDLRPVRRRLDFDHDLDLVGPGISPLPPSQPLSQSTLALAASCSSSQLPLLVTSRHVVLTYRWYGEDAGWCVRGNTFAVKDLLKLLGFQWNRQHKTWTLRLGWFISGEDELSRRPQVDARQLAIAVHEAAAAQGLPFVYQDDDHPPHCRCGRLVARGEVMAARVALLAGRQVLGCQRCGYFVWADGCLPFRETSASGYREWTRWMMSRNISWNRR